MDPYVTIKGFLDRQGANITSCEEEIHGKRLSLRPEKKKKDFERD